MYLQKPIFSDDAERKIVNQCCYLKRPLSDNAADCAEEIVWQLENAKDIEFAIGPEALFPCALNQCKRALALLQSHFYDKNCILGAYYKDNKTLYTSIYWFFKEQVIAVYHKQLLLPFVEKRATNWSWLFHHGISDYKYKQSWIWPLKINKQLYCVSPLLCAELFLSAKIPPAPIVLALIHNQSFPAYFNRMLYRIATFKAIIWQKRVLYVDDSGVFIIT